MSSARLFLALVPPPALQAQVTALKEYCRDHYASQAALRSPPHITLQPPFHWDMSQIATLEAGLRQWAAARSAVPIDIQGFGAFPPRVLYLDVQKTPLLLDLYAQLQTELSDRWQIQAQPPLRPFAPHLTIAFRDLKPVNFRRAWAEFCDRPYSLTFTATQLTLLEHDGQRWHSRADFPFHA